MEKLIVARRRQMIRALKASKRARRKPKPIQHPVHHERAYGAILRRSLGQAQLEIMQDLNPILHLFNQEVGDAIKINLAPKRPAPPTWFTSTIQRLKNRARLRVPVQQVKSVFSSLDEFNRNAMNESLAPVTQLPVWTGTTEAQQAILGEAITDNISLISSIEEDLHSRVESTLMNAWSEGKRSNEVAGMLQEQFGITNRRATLIARTEIGKVNAQLIETRATDVGIESYTWTTANDSRVRPRHRELNGTVHRFDNPPLSSEPGQPERYNNPGEDFQCLPGDAEITFPSPVNRAWRRWYTGELTALILEDGGILRSTPNHPVLTQSGWQPAQSLNIGDYIFDIQVEVADPTKHAVEHRVTCSEYFESLIKNGGCLSRMSGVATQFHNDGIVDQEIHTIDVNAALFHNVEASIPKGSRKFTFPVPNPDSPFFGAAGDRTLELCVTSYFPTTGSFIGCSRDLSLGFHSGVLESDQVGLSAIAGSEPLALEVLHDGGSRDIKSLAHGEHTFTSVVSRQSRFPIPVPFSVSLSGCEGGATNYPPNLQMPVNGLVVNRILLSEGFDPRTGQVVCTYLKPVRVSEIKSTAFDGFVYNFETHAGYYTSGNHLVHNCRCAAAPNVEGFLDKLLEEDDE